MENKNLNLGLQVQNHSQEQSSKKDEYLIQAIQMIEKLIKGENVSESELDDLKKKSGVVQNCQVNYLGILDGGYYGYEMILFNGDKKMFFCDPDDIDFYNHCIPDAVQRDDIPANRKRRLDMRREKKQEGSILKIEDAVKPIHEKSDLDKLRESIRNMEKEPEHKLTYRPEK